MSDEGDRARESLEQLRALARQAAQSLERGTGKLDLEAIADGIAMGGARVKDVAEFAGGWIKGQVDPDERAAPDTAERRHLGRGGGPHPLDVPTEEQGLALSALDSGRWKLEPETGELIAEDEAPAPDMPAREVLVSELRARDWITASGEVTLIGRGALRRWEEGP